MANDKVGDKLFSNVKTVEAFYIELSVIAEKNLKTETIQLYSLTKFRYILNY